MPRQPCLATVSFVDLRQTAHDEPPPFVALERLRREARTTYHHPVEFGPRRKPQFPQRLLQGAGQFAVTDMVQVMPETLHDRLLNDHGQCSEMSPVDPDSDIGETIGNIVDTDRRPRITNQIKGGQRADAIYIVPAFVLRSSFPAVATFISLQEWRTTIFHPARILGRRYRSWAWISGGSPESWLTPQIDFDLRNMQHCWEALEIRSCTTLPFIRSTPYCKIP